MLGDCRFLWKPRPWGLLYNIRQQDFICRISAKNEEIVVILYGGSANTRSTEASSKDASQSIEFPWTIAHSGVRIAVGIHRKHDPMCHLHIWVDAVFRQIQIE